MNERGIKAKVSVPRDNSVVRPNDITWKSLNQQRECASFGRRVRLSKTKMPALDVQGRRRDAPSGRGHFLDR
jgi:hypothetical protein